MPDKKPSKRDRGEVESSSDDSILTISRSDLREEIQNIVKIAINEAMEEKVAIFQGIRENMDMFTSEIDRLSSITLALKEALAEKEKDISNLRECIDNLKKENTELHCQLNDNENYQRRENIRITGIPEASSENPIKTACNFFTEKGFNVSEKELHIAHRIGRRNPGKPRTIIVRFFNRNTRDRVIRERKKLKGSGITISEDVSNLSMRTLMRVQRSQGISNAWIWNGQVCARHKASPDKTFIIKPFQSVAEARGS